MRRTWVVLAAGALLGMQAPAWPAATSEPVDLTYPAGEAPDEASGPPAISGDGRWVAFASASELTPEDDSESVDVYVRDLAEDRTILVTGVEDEAYRVHYDPSISDDGRFVSFISQGDGLVPEDVNGNEDVYVKDLQTGDLFVASARRNGVPAGGAVPVVSGDGEWVAFASNRLTRDDRNDGSDVYVRHLGTGKAFLVSRTTRGRQVDGPFDDVAVSDDGSRIAYSMYGGL
ncbi:MAG TPA: hypothetical protein VEU29_01990, partial [Actinomycetota bacterium]|nr:hypothetical protein [Actinomycetota bacterium]